MHTVETPKNKKFTLNSQLKTYQILSNRDQMLILRLSYFITTVSLSDSDHSEISAHSTSKI